MEVLSLTAEEALKKMNHNTDANNWDLLFNWIKQNHLSAKQFRRLIQKVLYPESEKSFKQDKYSYAREAYQEDMENFLNTPAGGGKKKKST